MAAIRAGVGFSEEQDSYEAGQRAASDALAQMGPRTGGLVLAFCTGKHDYQACFQGIRSQVGDTPVVGGGAVGVITNSNLGYEGHQVGVAVLPGEPAFHVAACGGLDEGETKVGLELATRLSAKRNSEEKLIVLFYDSVRSPPPPAPVLNVSTYLIQGFEQGIGKNPPPLVGAGLIGTYGFDRGKQFCGNTVADQHAVAVLISGEWCARTAIMHGCKPMSNYHTITRVKGAVVYEIDGKPALEVIDDLLGSREWQRRMPLLTVTLGVNHGNRYGPYEEHNYVNRLIVGILPQDQAIVLFEADFEDGTQFQFMRRNSELMAASAEQGSRKAMAAVEEQGAEPIFALYVDCAGRTAGFSGGDIEEASIVQEIVGKKVPLLGFYSGVEIAPLLGKSRGLDWTAVLLILARKK